MGREALSALELAHRSPWGPGCTWSSGFHDSCARGWGYSEFRKCAHRNPEGARLCDAQELYPLSLICFEWLTFAGQQEPSPYLGG